MAVHKIEVVYDMLVATIAAEYIGAKNGESKVDQPERYTGSMGLTTEPITAHPNFFEAAAGFDAGSSPIAGLPSDFGGGAYPDSELGPPVNTFLILQPER